MNSRNNPLLLCMGLILLASVGCGSPSSSNSSSVPASQPSLSTLGYVSATTHPLVAQYRLFVSTAAQIRVEFGTNLSYGRNTGSQLTPEGGGTVTLLVAGMRANTTYHMRARVDFGDGVTLFDSDHTFTTGALPQASFPAVTVTASGGLTAPAGVDLVSNIGTDVSAVVLDTDGSVIWYYYDPAVSGLAFPIRQLANGDYLINSGGDVREVDLEGRIVREVTLGQLNAALVAAGYSLEAYSFHHDLLGLKNGHWILLVNEVRDFQDLLGYPGTTPVLGDALVDLDEKNQPVWVWRAFDHLDVNRHPYLFPDWTHGNAIVYTPDGNLLLSMRHQSWIIKINYARGLGNGDIYWRLGPDGDFVLPESDPAEWFYNQHYPLLLSSKGSRSRLALYDNGDLRPDATGQPCIQSNTCYSRGVIMDLDESELTASIFWQYDLGWFSFWGGSIAVLPNAGVELDSSTIDGGSARIIEVGTGNVPQVIWQMDTSNSNFYRAYRIPSLYPGVNW